MPPPDPQRLSLNTATVKQQWTLAQMIDGVIDLPRIRGWVEGAGYAGFHEVEIFSELDWWRRDPDEVMRTIKERFKQT